MMNKTIQFTKEGYENLKKEYQKILESRVGAIKALSQAREMGDLSENGFYKAAKGKVLSINSSLRRLDRLIKSAKVVDNLQKEFVGIGSQVIVSEGETTRGFNIVGPFEAEPSKNKISDISPIGKALIGKRVGESVKVNTPKGEVIYKILKIE